MNMIWVKFQKEAIHCYPAALSEPKLSDVSFLGYPHRHIFHFKVYIEVYHNDRDLEFIQVKRLLQENFTGDNLNHKSCEMISDDINSFISEKWPGRFVKIEVSEDNENGSYKEYKNA